jgi:chemotaxis protein methyltransferase CheR
MSAAAFLPFYKLVEQQTGIFLDAKNKYLVELRLAELSQKQGCSDVEDFVAMLVRMPLGPIHSLVFEALTTHETMFFRDRAFFDALVQHIVPALVRRATGDKTLRICCAGVSTGQEAYSLAMLLQEFFPQLSDWDVYIQATDISAAALERARKGIYSSTEVERGLNPVLVNKYLLKVENQRYQIAPWLRTRVNFLQCNLLAPAPRFPRFDLILLRNVLIYFLQNSKNLALEQMKKQLQVPHGLLILGSTESIVANPGFKSVKHGKVCCYTHA